MKKYIIELYKRKDLLFYLTTSGLKAQHRNSFLGYFWWLLDPLLGVFIYYFVVAIIFERGGEDYGLYLVIGLVVWRWLSSAVGSASRSIIAQAGIITQVYLPKAIFPLSATLTQLINFAFGLIVVGIFLVFFRVIPGIELIWLFYVIVIQLFFLLAITLVLAYVGVFIRDINTLITHILRLWFYGSPVIWPQDIIPQKISWVLDINPMTHFLNGYRSILMYHKSPELIILSVIGLLSIVVIILMISFYSKNEHNIIKSL